MNRPREETGGRRAHRQRVDSTRMPNTPSDGLQHSASESAYAMRQTHRNASTLHGSRVLVSDRHAPSPQAPPIRGTVQNPRTAQPHHDARRQQTPYYYDGYSRTTRLRATNPDPTVPRPTFRQLAALRGEPDARPRRFDRPVRGLCVVSSLDVAVDPPAEPRRSPSGADGDAKPQQGVEYGRGQVEYGLGQVESGLGQVESVAHQQRREDTPALIDRGACTGTTQDSTGTRSFVDSSRVHTAAKGFALIRFGSGRRAKLRRDFKGFLGIKHD
ncbi:uncharacterized protein M421DRAFT_253751 [Didymella exigua CBS 183.55]|uniref:Uncharacterized protein n=1 Tax=Didymella exigua CBS 183.55 TaxID=1150837 RepID=A0A6A5RWT4_9PLEO|nr:uncharacterized protein M421DRAFT_253751 [Didymella exigua CBS 183.55]KAF1932965.1 hypothetical protein M421DRAFT_253751 [Didymella exigua CBS 183.55]